MVCAIEWRFGLNSRDAQGVSSQDVTKANKITAEPLSCSNVISSGQLGGSAKLRCLLTLGPNFRNRALYFLGQIVMIAFRVFAYRQFRCPTLRWSIAECYVG